MSEPYLRQILARERVDKGPFSSAYRVRQTLLPVVNEWAGNLLADFSPSGSFAKGTAVASGTDIDMFISITPACTHSLGDIYESLFSRLAALGYSPKRQRVSIGVRLYDGATKVDVDLVPGRQQDWGSADHSLHIQRGEGIWTKTNVAEHIKIVRDCGRLDEIRLFKIWRNLSSFEWPSFYVELTVIEALRGVWYGTLEENVRTVLVHLRDRFETTRVIDPANTNNVLSDDLSAGAKMHVAKEAAALLGPNGTWGGFVR